MGGGLAGGRAEVGRDIELVRTTSGVNRQGKGAAGRPKSAVSFASSVTSDMPTGRGEHGRGGDDEAGVVSARAADEGYLLRNTDGGRGAGATPVDAVVGQAHMRAHSLGSAPSSVTGGEHVPSWSVEDTGDAAQSARV